MMPRGSKSEAKTAELRILESPVCDFESELTLWKVALVFDTTPAENETPTKMTIIRAGGTVSDASKDFEKR